MHSFGGPGMIDISYVSGGKENCVNPMEGIVQDRVQ